MLVHLSKLVSLSKLIPESSPQLERNSQHKNVVHFRGSPSINLVFRRLRAPWRKRLDTRLPSLGSRVRVSILHVGFRCERNRVWIVFSRGFSRFPLAQISFHNFSTLISFISFNFISSAPVMVRQAWSVDTLSLHRSSTKRLHRISSFDPTLYRT